jgi:hypothetical protein
MQRRSSTVIADADVGMPVEQVEDDVGVPGGDGGAEGGRTMPEESDARPVIQLRAGVDKDRDSQEIARCAAKRNGVNRGSFQFGAAPERSAVASAVWSPLSIAAMSSRC